MLRAIVNKARSHFLDIGKPNDVTILAGMGRSGTTWAGDIVNHDGSYRVLFEPFYPVKVKQAAEFEYIQYLNPDCQNELLSTQANKILAGKIRNEWVDRGGNRFLYRRRIIKEIRCNLMLGWLGELAIHPRIVLMIRHPLQVVSSWSKLGWGKRSLSNKNDLEIILSQHSLLEDFPIIGEIKERINEDDFVESIAFLWCINHLVPIGHLKKNQAHVLFYENLLTDPNNEMAKLFDYLERPFDLHELQKTMKKSSSTNFLKRDFHSDKSRLFDGWKSEFSKAQIQNVNSILSVCGLGDLYDEDGYPTGVPVLGESTS